MLSNADGKHLIDQSYRYRIISIIWLYTIKTNEGVSVIENVIALDRRSPFLLGKAEPLARPCCVGSGGSLPGQSCLARWLINSAAGLANCQPIMHPWWPVPIPRRRVHLMRRGNNRMIAICFWTYIPQPAVTCSTGAMA